MYAIQSAMAVRRQRQMRESRRMSQLRMSTKTSRKGSSSQRPSDADSVDPKTHQVKEINAPPKAETSQTAFYLGVVFILLGFLMIFSSMISSSATDQEWSKLLGVGVTFLIVGLIMVMVNRIITAREEEELTRYVSHRLARTRSGHMLARDSESCDDFHRHYRKFSSVPKSPREPKSPHDKLTDPFPKFRPRSQTGSTRAKPAAGSQGRRVRSASHHSGFNHSQNGTKPTEQPIPVVIVDEPSSSDQPHLNAIAEQSAQGSNENGGVPFSCEVISETESLLKESQSIKKFRPKRNSNES